MERLIYNRLSWYVEHNHILSPAQFGFRKRRSCVDNLAILLSEVFSGFTSGEVVAGLFLDLKGAFPSVIPQILTEDLKEIGFPQQMAKFIYNATSCKNVYYKINGELVGPRRSTVGLPQGCILSPINCTIYTRKIHLLIPGNCSILEFADDIAILCRSANPAVCIKSLQQCLNILADSLGQRGLELCPEKPKLVLFIRQNLDTSDPSLTLSLNNVIISPSIHVRFLGIILDVRLSFQFHFLYLCDKIRKILNIFKVLRGTWWGAEPRILRMVYTSLIRSSLEYGSHVFNFSSHKYFDKIEKIRNQALRLAIGFRGSTPISVMLAECCEPPFKKRFSFLA